MGRVPAVMSKSVEKHGLSYIRPHHREMARRLVLGQIAADICRELGLSESRFSIIRNTSLFKIEVKKLEEERDKGTIDITQQLREISPVALEVVERGMYKAKSEALQVHCAESILDRAGHGRVTKSQVDVKGSIGHTHMTTDELRRLVKGRVNRMQEEIEEEKRLELEANAIDIKFEELEPELEGSGYGRID